ncbi:MAG: hypothetical protein KBC43_00990 [Bacteroidales bacterium]|nr:hypothetical protein [Bacteroidales bacterium]HPI86646.1 hypothetical protein [Bacteroidales bacterium]HPM91666.1 hypothetical protein [Bacteroidales bacterium]
MDKKIIKGLIDDKLEVIQEQFSIIRAYEGKIPVIELDLILGSIRDLYELVLGLQQENMAGTKPEPVIIPEEEQPEEPIIEVTLPTPPEPKPEPSRGTETAGRFASGILSMEPVREESPKPELIRQAPPAYIRPTQHYAEPVAVETKVAPDPEPEPFINKDQTTEAYLPEMAPVADSPSASEDKPAADNFQRTTFDLFSDVPPVTIADRLREGQDKRLADKLQEKITDLRSAIGINDKFLFINELFDGNMRVYDDIVQKLSSAATIAQIDLLLLDLKIAYNWDSESPTVKKFVDLVRRRF